MFRERDKYSYSYQQDKDEDEDEDEDNQQEEQVEEVGKRLKIDDQLIHHVNTSRSSPHHTTTSSNQQHQEQQIINMGRRLHMLGPPPLGLASTTLNTVTPCAACKLLRRRCAQECPFSPYFSPHQPHKFAAVHKVFGASNVSKMLLEVDQTQRADAANSLVYEANVRLRDPVYGCMGAISAMQQQLQTLQAELNAVRSHILKCKFTHAAAAAAAANSLISNTSAPTTPQPTPPPPPLPLSKPFTSLSTHHRDRVPFFD